MKVKKILLLIISLLISSCNNQTNNEEKDIEVSKIVVNENKRYLQVDNKPFIYNGIQIRIDWLMDVNKESIEDMEYYFKKASELNVKVVEIPLQWKDLEVSEGAYNFRNLSKMLTYANKYNLKVELLLFTTNIGGMSGCAPTYIKENKELYPQYENSLNHKDALFFVQDNENILKREGAMVEALMDSIYNFSKSTNTTPVIAIQVKNEPDLYLKRIKENNVSLNGKILSDEYAIKETLTAIDYIAKIIKKSKYKIITRINLCCFVDHISLNYRLWDEILSLKSIDVVGEDTYNPSISFNKNIILDMQEKLYPKYNTIAQIAENTGHYTNNPSLILTSNILGASYLMYDLITPKTITDEWNYYDWGILDNKTLEGKEAFNLTKTMLNGINLANSLLITTKSEDIAGFNIKDNEPLKEISQTINTSKTSYTFTTNNNAIGYAINYNDEIYLYATNEASITINDNTLEKTYYDGYVLDDNSFNINNTYTLTNNTINLKKDTLYKLKVIKTNTNKSNTLEFLN